MFKDHEKFWAFLILIASICSLVVLASTFDKGSTAADIVVTGKLRIIDGAIAGLLAITGMAAQALFRVGVEEAKASGEAIADAMKNRAPLDVTVQQPANQPIPTHDAGFVEPVDGELPESEKL